MWLEFFIRHTVFASEQLHALYIFWMVWILIFETWQLQFLKIKVVEKLFKVRNDPTQEKLTVIRKKERNANGLAKLLALRNY